MCGISGYAGLPRDEQRNVPARHEDLRPVASTDTLNDPFSPGPVCEKQHEDEIQRQAGQARGQSPSHAEQPRRDKHGDCHEYPCLPSQRYV